MGALKALLAEKLAEAAAEPGGAQGPPGGLALFKDALQHVCRIHRCLGGRPLGWWGWLWRGS